MTNDGPPGVVERRCRLEGCPWHIAVEKEHKTDREAELDADTREERHFDREHRGEARIKIVLDTEVSPHPEQDLASIVDSYHDKIDDADLPHGVEVAYAVGEFIEEPSTPDD